MIPIPNQQFYKFSLKKWNTYPPQLQILRRGGGGPTPPRKLKNFCTLVQNALKSVRKVTKTIKISWGISSNYDFFLWTKSYHNIWAFEKMCAHSFDSKCKSVGNFVFGPCPFNKFGSKSNHVVVWFEYRANEGRRINSSTPTKTQPNSRTYIYSAGN